MADAALAVRRHAPLAPLTTLGVGGAAEWFAVANDAGDVQAAHAWCAERRQPLHVLGGGSNLVVADEGVQGLVLQVAIGGVAVRGEGSETVVRAGAGEGWDGVVALAVERGLAGLECLSGIPGSVGGTPIQNVGAYGQEVADTIERVHVFDRHSGEYGELGAGACAFSYRSSRFKGADAGRFVVCGVEMRLRRGEPTVTYPDIIEYLRHAGAARPSLGQTREAVLAVRRRKGMVVDPADPDSRSVGSFFMNPVVAAAARERVSSAAGAAAPGFVLPDGRVKLAAAWLIEQAGFARGFADGAVGLSSKHPLAIVNRGGAAASDVVRLAVRIKRRVLERFGVALRPEPVFVGFRPAGDVEYLLQERG
jgi:UDP-N-acetylmuramate dehydrogenase